MKNKIYLVCIALFIMLNSCKKEDEVIKKGLAPTVENLAGTWTLQYSRTDYKDHKSEWTTSEIAQPNTQVYTFNADLSYNLKTMSTDGLNTVYNKNGSYKIIESSLEAEMVKHINFDNYGKIDNVIKHIDNDYLELYTIGGTSGITSRSYSYYVKIKQ